MKEYNFDEVNNGLMNFLDKSPNAFFAVDNAAKMLEEAGARELFERDDWNIIPGRKYFVKRNDSAIIAFEIPKKDFAGFMIMASHSDSPVFKIKANEEIVVENKYVKLNIEKYGGMLINPWFDRPLSLAGRVIIKTDEGIRTRLVDIDRDLLIIPSLAIHMDRDANQGHKINAQKELLPLFTDVSTEDKEEDKDKIKSRLLNIIAAELEIKAEDIIDTDLYLYNRMKAAKVGLNGEYIASKGLDDLSSAYASLKGFIDATPESSAAVCAIFDNEEVGSGSKQGAAGTFLKDVIDRINEVFSEVSSKRRIDRSYMISADNAHAVHPNFSEKSDPTNRPFLNQGIVIKYSANQKYTTDAVSSAIFKTILERNDIPYQTFFNRSDMLGGSTLGNIAQSQISVKSVDIGLPQLAMHSPDETQGAKDTAYLCFAAKCAFESGIDYNNEGDIVIK